jgi:iron(II)-dependent oxidoreductase
VRPTVLPARAPGTADLLGWLLDARDRTLRLVDDLDDARWMGPRLDVVNPVRWETGHVAWFQERWVLRRPDGPSRVANADALYDSAAVPHRVRWDLPLLARGDTYAYLRDVLERALERVREGEGDDALAYFVRLAVHHEDMHGEAFAYTRQTHGWPAPVLGPRPPEPACSPAPGDARVPGGTFPVGASPEEPFVFDNEKWEHPVRLRPFSIARRAVTQAEFAAFVEDGGYARRDLWTDGGWAWRVEARAEGPLHWERRASRWWRRDFDRWVPLEPRRAMVHVNAHEADAWCRWAGRRLPTEAEWEAAAAGEPDGAGGLAPRKRRYPWGDEPPTPERANLDGLAMGAADVEAHPAGDSAFGCRQMLGNVWEWCADPFLPYPGFVADPYREYSEPWFGSHRVLRGGCWVTRSRLLRNTWRNFYTPDRRDVWAGFRTCAT